MHFLDTMSKSTNCNTATVEQLLAKTRKNIINENPSEALSALLEAVRLTQGEDAVTEILDKTKMNMPDLTDVEHAVVNEEDMVVAARKMSAYLQNDEKSILFEISRTDILRDAFEDGSSVVCKACGSLIPRARADNHSKFWCDAVEHNMEVDSD